MRVNTLMNMIWVILLLLLESSRRVGWNPEPGDWRRGCEEDERDEGRVMRKREMMWQGRRDKKGLYIILLFT